jgi:hypothetical protein
MVQFKKEPKFKSLHGIIFLDDGPIKLAHCKKKKKIELGRCLVYWIWEVNSFYMMWFTVISSVLNKLYSLAHQQCFENIEPLPNGSTSFDLLLQNKIRCIFIYPTFSAYRYESSTLGKPYGLKLRCYWECLWEQFGNLKNLVGTWKTNKRTPLHPPPPPKRKKQGPSWVHAELSHWLHETFISKTNLSPFLACANGRGTHCGTTMWPCKSISHFQV